MKQKYLIFYLFVAVCLQVTCKNDTKNSITTQTVDQQNINEAKSNSKESYVAALSGMNMRATPALSGNILTLVQYSEKIEVLDKTGINIEVEGISGEWYKVKYNDIEGYLFSGFLLDFEPPTGAPSVGFENYLTKYYNTITPKQAYSIRIDESNERVTTPIAMEKVIINEEFDTFEIIEKFEGGRTYKEVIGYESSTKTIFIPNLNMREGFLLMKGILPYLHIYDDCGLELSKVPFPKKNNTIKVGENCSFEIEITSNDTEVTSLNITNVDFAYSGLTLVKVEGGIEISQYFAL